ncbi:MAG: DNA polymerase III subunit beta [Selenomonadaceae bacterium]|nr:DNA polymerase III subunit beta [Selenomonadaceae bacterium]
MNFTCSRKDLVEAFNVVSKAVSSKPQMPILSGIYMKAEGSTLELQANNFEMGIITKIPVNTEDPGEIVVTGKYLQEVVRKLSGETVNISHDESQHIANIKSDTANFKLLSMSSEDFPKVKSPETFSTFSLRAATLKNLIRKTAYACANEEVRPIFTGCCLELAGNSVSMIATNTHRLAIMKDTFDAELENLTFVVPSKTLWELFRMIDYSDPSNSVTIDCSRKNISFTFDNIFMTSRLIDGQFPPYDKVIPQTAETIATVKVAEMMEAVDRVALISKETEYNTIRFIFTQEGINISSDSPEVGRAEEQISAKIEGADIDISFNVKYIVDVLKVIDSEECVIKLNKPLSPVDIREKDRDNFIYVVTPVRTN